MSTNKRVIKSQRAHIHILSELVVGASYGILGEAAVSSLVSLNSLWSILLKLFLTTILTTMKMYCNLKFIMLHNVYNIR